MNLTMTPDKADITAAIELMINKCFPALSVANALGGSDTIPWRLAREIGFAELVASAREHGVDIAGLRGNVDGRSILSAPIYAKARRELSGLDLPEPDIT